MADEEFDPDKLRETIDAMVEAVTAPAFVEAVRAVRTSPEDQRLAEGARRLSPDALRAQGVPLPPDMRITTRYFEPGQPGTVAFGEHAGDAIAALNEAEPGLLDRLRTSSPELFEKMMEDVSDRIAVDMMKAGIGGCACAGHRGTCTGIGGSL
jgi:hypothetical protein